MNIFKKKKEKIKELIDYKGNVGAWQPIGLQ